MSETKDFTYEGNCVVQLKREPVIEKSNDPVKEIVVFGIEHMIPINVTCELDGEPSVVTAYIDYTSNNIQIPPDTTNVLRGADDLFRESLVNYLMNRNAEATRDHEEMYPPQEIPESYSVPQPPEVVMEKPCPTSAE